MNDDAEEARQWRLAIRLLVAARQASDADRATILRTLEGAHPDADASLQDAVVGLVRVARLLLEIHADAVGLAPAEFLDSIATLPLGPGEEAEAEPAGE